MITDRMRFIVIEVNTNRILTRDLIVKEPELVLNLSAPARLSCSIDQGQRFSSAYGIDWKSYGQWIIPEITTDQFGTKLLAALMVTSARIDPESGDMLIDAEGFMGYLKGIPWLENYNPIAVDPAEIIQRIVGHVQSFPNANLGIDAQPSETGTQMLPGYGFDGSILSFDFFAIFVRAVDFVDCGDFVTSLARDLPLDLFEDVSWNTLPGKENEVVKTLRIAYPLGGLQQDWLAFRLGENVINAELAEEMDIEPVSDIIIRSWWPGKVYSSQLLSITNEELEEILIEDPDWQVPTRARRIAMEEDVNINSTERSAAWAKRKLSRRNVPKYFSKIVIDPNHPNALFGSFGLGDSIYVEANDYPWIGDIAEWHRITSITMKQDEPFIELGLKVEGAFNYDPIYYDPQYEEKPTLDMNLLSNGYFTRSLSGWRAIKGQWIRVATAGYTKDGCVRIDCDDMGEEFRSEKVFVMQGETFLIRAAVKFDSITDNGSAPWTFAIGLLKHFDGGEIGTMEIIDTYYHTGAGGYVILSNTWSVPAGSPEINEISISLLVNDNVTGGKAFWDDVRVVPVIP